jgi:hypothetical protein
VLKCGFQQCWAVYFILKIKHLIIIFWKFRKSKNLHSKCFKKNKIGIEEPLVSFF